MAEVDYREHFNPTNKQHVYSPQAKKNYHHSYDRIEDSFRQMIVPDPTARSAVSSVSPGRGY
jgi:hypothetical protein